LKTFINKWQAGNSGAKELRRGEHVACFDANFFAGWNKLENLDVIVANNKTNQFQISD
jgi:hypothetical protein